MFRSVLSLFNQSTNGKIFLYNNISQKCLIPNASFARMLHGTHQLAKERTDLRTYRMTMPKKDDGAAGETMVDLDSFGDQVSLYPDEDTPNKLFDGVPYKNLPICTINVSKNNAKFQMADAKGLPKLFLSNGMEGFKKARKGTNIAAQTTAISFGTKSIAMGIRTIRVKIAGLGPGRQSAIKGLHMSGMRIVSITDSTAISWSPPRPRKARRV